VPEPEQVGSLDDLAPTIELYHHTVRAGRYDEAQRLYNDRLADPLHFRFGAYQLIIELLRALFPGGEPLTPSGEAALPRLSEESAQAWTLNELANSSSLSGQSGRAVPLFEAAVALVEKRGNKRNVAISLGAVAKVAYMPLGTLAMAEENLRRSIKILRKSGDEYPESWSQEELGRLLALEGRHSESIEPLLRAFQLKDKHYPSRNTIVWSYRALRALLTGEAGAALEAARRARELADVECLERDIIRAEWLLGAAHRARGELAQAEPRLAEALRRCRRINMVDHEPKILLELARLRHAQGRGEALSLAQEALEIADRCQYRLVEADCHNFLAELALKEGNRQKAQEHAETARERAWCDGPPHRYEAAFQEAERLLERIGSLKH
jgi:tetratricopeptide (TPR) repeat protein